jgi:hypothetical protein
MCFLACPLSEQYHCSFAFVYCSSAFVELFLSATKLLFVVDPLSLVWDCPCVTKYDVSYYTVDTIAENTGGSWNIFAIN